MEQFNANQVVLELIELAQTPDQVAWLKTVAPEINQNMIQGLRDVAKEAEAEASRFRLENRKLEQKYAEHLSLPQVTAIIKALVPRSGCDC